jgi:signal transduction histidine kinase
MGQYAETFLASAGLRCRLDLPGEVPSQVLPANVRHQLFMVVKEALHNAARHAGAGEVQLALKLENGTLALSVTDNGHGVPEGRKPESDGTGMLRTEPRASASTTSGSGHGLVNMRQRVESLGGEFRMTSSPGNGTCVTVRIPLAQHR